MFKPAMLRRFINFIRLVFYALSWSAIVHVKHAESSTTSTGKKVLSDAFIQMFEWTWNDLARECPRIGADGWQGIQISAVLAHRNILPGETTGDPGQDLPYAWYLLEKII